MAAAASLSTLAAVALFATALPLPAQAQESVVAARLWNTFMQICPLMLTDPQAYANRLQIPGPNGEKVVSQMAEGNVVEFDTTIDGFTHSGLILVIGRHEEIGCSMSTYAVGTPDTALSPERTNKTFMRRISEYDGVQVVGGLVDKEIPSPIPGVPVQKIQNYYQYWITGLVPEADAVAQVFLADGSISYHMHSYILLEEDT